MGLFTDRDIRETNQSKAGKLKQKCEQGLLDIQASSVILVDTSGVAVEKYQVGHQTDLGVTDALELLQIAEKRSAEKVKKA